MNIHRLVFVNVHTLPYNGNYEFFLEPKQNGFHVGLNYGDGSYEFDNALKSRLYYRGQPLDSSSNGFYITDGGGITFAVEVRYWEAQRRGLTPVKMDNVEESVIKDRPDYRAGFCKKVSLPHYVEST